MPDTTDPAASALDEIRARWSKVDRVLLKPEAVPEPGHQAPWLPDIPRLLAALKDALKLADDWKREAGRLEPSGADAVQPATPGNYLVSGRIGALEDCAGELRAAIILELNGSADV